MLGFSSFSETPFATLPGAATQTLVQATRFDNTNTFYSATVLPGAVTLQPSLYTNTNTFYSSTLSASITLQPNR